MDSEMACSLGSPFRPFSSANIFLMLCFASARSQCVLLSVSLYSPVCSIKAFWFSLPNCARFSMRVIAIGIVLNVLTLSDSELGHLLVMFRANKSNALCIYWTATTRL